jgi:hypothetical protein
MRRDGSITCYRRLGWWEADMKGNSRGSALLDQNFFGSFLENPLRAVEWDLTFHEVPLDVREAAVRSCITTTCLPSNL